MQQDEGTGCAAERENMQLGEGEALQLDHGRLCSRKRNVWCTYVKAAG